MSDSLPPPLPPGPAGSGQRSGCLITLYVIFGVGVLLVIVAGVGFYLALQSETGQDAVKTLRAGIDLAGEASSAPGTDALREEGCSEALVAEFSQIEEVGIVQDGEESGFAADDLFVACVVDFFAEPVPTCEVVAASYGRTVPDPPARFFVIVTKNGREACSGYFSADGTPHEEP